MRNRLEEGIKIGAFPGYVFWGGGLLADKIVEFGGQREVKPKKKAMTLDTVFDLASLTKVIVTTPLALYFLEKGQLRLEDHLSRFFPQIPYSNITIRHLLTHTSGLPAWAPLFIKADQALDFLMNLPQHHPEGTKVVYSCMGFIILGKVLEQVGEQTLDQLANEILLRPLGMNNTSFNPLKGPFAATEYHNLFEQQKGAPPRAGIMRGVVHDGNAYSLGGVAGNAGLFGTAADLAKYARFILQHGAGILSKRSIEIMAKLQTPLLESPRGLGWCRTGLYCSGGDLLGENSVGHTGFTGTSLWIDFDHELFGILLTNRVHPHVDSQEHIRMRPLIYNAAWAQMISV